MALDQDLLPAERRLVEDGTLDARTGDAKADDPAGSDDWSEDRTVRAHVLRHVLLADSPTRVHVAGARITEVLDVQGMTIERSVLLERCHFEEGLDLQDVALVSLRLPGCRLAGGLSARGCRLRGDLELDQGFRSEAEVVLAGASVGGLVSGSNATFHGPGGVAIDARALSVEGDFHLMDAKVEGGVSLFGARVKGIVACVGGDFRNPTGDAFNGDNLFAGGGVRLSAGFRAKGAVRLLHADIKGEFSCAGAHLINENGAAFRADRMRMHGDVFLTDNFQAEGGVSFVGAEIDGQLIISDAVISSHRDALALDLEGASIGAELFLLPAKPLNGWIDLTNAQVGSLRDDPAAWHGGYELRGFQYRRIRSVWEEGNQRRWIRGDTAVRHRLTWLRGNRSGYLPQLYDQLIEVYGAAGEEVDQRHVLIAKQRRRRGQLPFFARLWNFAEDVLIGFGYRTGRALIPFFAFLAFGWWYFDNAKEDGEIVARSTAEDVTEPPFHALLYSLDQLVPVVNFGQRGSWIATGDAQMLATVMVIVGWILTTAILAALTGLVRRNN